VAQGGGDSFSLPCQIQNVTVRVVAAAGWSPRTVRVYRIDGQHANPAETWAKMGSPEYMTPAQLATLQTASANIDGAPMAVTVTGGAAEVTVVVPAQAVVVLKGWE
jgi:xylan 1,4-beta-xylosidase